MQKLSAVTALIADKTTQEKSIPVTKNGNGDLFLSGELRHETFQHT